MHIDMNRHTPERQTGIALLGMTRRLETGTKRHTHQASGKMGGASAMGTPSIGDRGNQPKTRDGDDRSAGVPKHSKDSKKGTKRTPHAPLKRSSTCEPTGEKAWAKWMSSRSRENDWVTGNVPVNPGLPVARGRVLGPLSTTSRRCVGPVSCGRRRVTGGFPRSPGFEKGSGAVALANLGVCSGGSDDANPSLAGCRSLHAAPLVWPLTDEAGEGLCCEGLRTSHYPSWRTFSLKISAVERTRVAGASWTPGPSSQAQLELSLQSSRVSSDISMPQRGYVS
ncbi:uncharacterized protein B0H64DRAFT_24863 [Chaetomium fimeti]|uniref:Uncharacterized protein n=1 Tax=Chaetomium fimeti TaxID=1854472 RepID=A0AAE0HQT1_9PEZI|nr:hypothetical protein B0H64DRAFT_24863 [Chaetomium fimeti]